MRWIRWKYILPRLVIVAFVLLVAELATGPAVRHFLIASGEKVVGARVDIASAKGSVLGSRLTLNGIAIANPNAPMENLVQADRLEIDFETSALLRKKVIANRGSLRGLQFETARDSSGELLQTERPETDADRFGFDFGLGGQAVDMAEQWFENLGEQFSSDLTSQFESVRLSQQLAERWPTRYDNLQERANALTAQVRDLQAKVKTAQANPLRHIDFLKNLPNELKSLNESLLELHAEIGELPNELEADREAIFAARQHDQQLLREKLHVDTIDSAALTAYFLRERLAGPIGDVVRWIRWARETMPAGAPPEPVRHRGIDILFAGSQPLPDVLIRSLDLQGTARISGQPVELTGTLTNITSHPAIHGKPTRLELATTGSLPIKLQATLDRTGEVPRDEVLVDCRGLLLPKMQLGSKGKLGISLAPSTGFLNISVLLEGEKLTGNVQLVQKNVQITPTVSEELAGWHLENALYESLGRLSSIATRVSITGTLDEPEYEIWSNLGPAVSQAMQTALQRALRSKADQLLAESNKRVESQLAAVNQMITQRTASLLPQIDAPQNELQQLAKNMLGGSGLSLEQLGRRLPANSLFR